MEPAYLPPHQALFRDGVHASSVPVNLPALIAPSGDGVQASSAALLQFTDAALPVRDLTAPGNFSENAAHASKGVDRVAKSLPIAEPPRDAVHAPLAVDLAGVSNATAAYSADVISCSSGASPDRVAEVWHAFTQLSKQLDVLASTNSVFASTASSSAVWAVPEFRGFQDDAALWIEAINSFGSRYAWHDNQKWLVAIDRLRGGAEAWHKYEGVKQRSWTEWSGRLIAVFGRIDVTPPAPRYQATHHQTRPLLTVQVHVLGIGELTALVQTGAPRTALHRRHAPANLEPWPEAPLRGLGGCAFPVGALDLHLQTEAGSKFLAGVPVFEDLPGDMILGADYLLSGEVRLTVDSSGVNLSRLTPSTASSQCSQVDRPQPEVSADNKSTFCDQADKHLLASQPSLAEGANASLKEANTEAIDATGADVAGIGHSGSLPLQVDGASIDHSGSPTCESGDDGKCSILTPGIPPERRADQDEVALAVMGSVTDRLAGDQLDQSSEMLSETSRSSDVERRYGGVHVHGRGTEAPETTVCPCYRRLKDCRNSNADAATPNHDHAPQLVQACTHSSLCKYLPAQRANGAGDQRPKLLQENCQLSVPRPLRHSQFRPPELSLKERPDTLQRWKDRPLRCSQCRPPDISAADAGEVSRTATDKTMLTGCHTCSVAECNEEERHRALARDRLVRERERRGRIEQPAY